MNIMIINHYAGSPAHGMEYRHYYLARHFVRDGHQVDIVAASFSHLRSRAPEAKGSVSQEVIDGISYWWLRTPRYEGNGAGRVLNMTKFGVMLMTKKKMLSAKCSPDIVVASSPHPFAIFGAAAIARASRAKLIFEVRDLWPLSLTEVGGISRAHLFIRFMQWTEDFAYDRADYVVSLLPKAKDYMVSRGMGPEKFFYIPNGIDVQEWREYDNDPDDSDCEMISREKEQGVFFVGYAGAHGIANGLDTLIEAAALLHSRSVRFVLVGKGPEKGRLQKRVEDMGLNNVDFLPAIPKSEIPKLLSRMDALYIGLKNEPLFRFGISPNKLMDYMMAGKPIIHAINSGNDIVMESGCGFSVQSGKPEEIADAIIRMRGMSQEEMKEMGIRGRRYVLKHHDYKVLAKRLLDVIHC